MRILYLANNRVGWKVAEYLAERGEDIVGVVLHPEARRSYGQEILAATGVDEQAVFDGSKLTERQTIAKIESLSAEIAISVFFGPILKPEFLDLYGGNVINLHPALLPHNRGAYPNVWSIVDGTPAGATLHYIDASVDTGDIIAQKQIAVEPIDTGQALYGKLEQACIELFQETWPAIKSGTAPRTPQAQSSGTAHRVRDVDRIDRIDLDATVRAGDLLNILRARTFPPHRGSYFEQDGRRVYVRLELEYDADDVSQTHKLDTP